MVSTVPPNWLSVQVLYVVSKESRSRSYAAAATRIFFREPPTTPAPRWR
jgi:hypothetical protein